MLRRAFEFGYRDHPDHSNPACALKGARIRRRDLPRIDLFRIQDAEALIAAIHQDWGEVQGNFHELRFFTGLRPSEEIALKERDFDEVRGTLSVTKARVYGVDKDTTKTHEDRVVHLCPRAIAVLTRQLGLYRHLKSRRRIDHDQLFSRTTARQFDISDTWGSAGAKAQSAWGSGSGAPISNLLIPQRGHFPLRPPQSPHLPLDSPPGSA